jgi:hypothetical protein
MKTPYLKSRSSVMKYEMHPTNTYCNDTSRMYAEVHSRISKDLLKTWVYKPIRDLYWESLKNSFFEDKDYQPYALMKHKCGHRTVGVVAMCRNKLGRDGIIKYLKEERESDCFYCMFTREQKENEKARSDYFTFKHIIHHLFSKHHYCKSCSAKKLIDVEFNPVEKGYMIGKPDEELEEMDTFKHYY